MHERHVRRDRSLEVEPLGDGVFAFEARLTDASHGGHHDPPSDTATIHDFRIVGEVRGTDLVLGRLEVEALTHPYPGCPFILPACDALVGASLASGWRHEVLRRLRGPSGCTHVVSLLLGLTELTTLTFFLRINESVPYGAAHRAAGDWNAAGLDAVPDLGDACHVLTTDGPVLSLARERRAARPGTIPLSAKDPHV
ncbi:hypothetical protein GCM10009836_26280 [Pseudonocardia ailaonensis]|uniref:DUF2889 domain-containing protein n=1 Tax=Pseudonocardia ailaonensis TaxID=367279 RepID=A0ABN2MZW5_9PSEU